MLNGWCIEACVGGVTGWAIGAGGDPRNRLETAQQMAAHAKARAHRTLKLVPGQWEVQLTDKNNRTVTVPGGITLT